jgi:hypothetical protein
MRLHSQVGQKNCLVLVQVLRYLASQTFMLYGSGALLVQNAYLLTLK